MSSHWNIPANMHRHAVCQCEQSSNSLRVTEMNSWKRLCRSIWHLLVNTDTKTGDTVYMCNRGV
eukprot:83459-Rhodomonas_salina.1